MLFARLATVSATVAATSSRTGKRQHLAALITDLAPAEVEPAIGFLIGTPRQGALGVGWATVGQVKAEPAGEATLTVGDIDTLLSALLATTGPGSVAAKHDLLHQTMVRATAPEQEFLARLLIGDLRQGALAGVVTDAVANAAGVKLKEMRRAVMLSGDLGVAAGIALDAGAEGLATVDLEVGRPIQPMLAATAGSVGEAVEAFGLAQVEWKLDGARIQVHRDGDEVRVYTRNLNDVTGRVPHIVEEVRTLACRRVVLDGEVIGYFDHDETPRPFQDTMSAFDTSATPSEEAGLRPYFFDLMYLDDRSLIDVPLAERAAALEALVGERQIPRIVTDDPDRAADHLQLALDQGHEGVMVKGVDSPYEAGRRGKTWRKVKPVHTLDLVVLAAEWGHGRRRGWLSNLHLGARHPDSGELVMVGKTFKGLTDELLAWQTEQFLAREIPAEEAPGDGEGAEGRHVVWVRPDLVVEIALDGAQRSTRYPGGVALRFARVKGYRPDRDPASADTLDAVRALL